MIGAEDEIAGGDREHHDGSGPVVVLAYDGVAGDEAGLLVEILTGAGLEVVVATVGLDPVTSFHGRVVADRTVAQLSGCRALIVPGGMGVRRAATDQPFIAAIAQLAADATWLGATSTGSVLLAAAGVVDGARATTHWLAGDLAADHGLELVRAPFVEHGRLLTVAGAASAPRLAFRLVGALAGARAEEEAKAEFTDRPVADPRYRKPVTGWRRLVGRLLGAGEVADVPYPLDPTGQAEIVVLDLYPESTGLDADR